MVEIEKRILTYVEKKEELSVTETLWQKNKPGGHILPKMKTAHEAK